MLKNFPTFKEEISLEQKKRKIIKKLKAVIKKSISTLLREKRKLKGSNSSVSVSFRQVQRFLCWCVQLEKERNKRQCGNERAFRLQFSSRLGVGGVASHKKKERVCSSVVVRSLFFFSSLIKLIRFDEINAFFFLTKNCCTFFAVSNLRIRR